MHVSGSMFQGTNDTPGIYSRIVMSHLQNLCDLGLVLGKDNVGRAVVSNVVAGLWVVGGVDATAYAPSLQEKR